MVFSVAGRAHSGGGFGLSPFQDMSLHPFGLEVFSNAPLWAAFFSWCSAQAIKMAIDFAKTRRVDFRYFVSTGGMPSAHSATVTGLATSLGLVQGWDSPIVALASVFAIITMFDAATVRHAAGLQAQVLNEIVEELRKDRRLRAAKLKELLGHTRKEVLAGFLWGIAFSSVFTVVWTRVAERGA